jgi:hypothetical protein
MQFTRYIFPVIALVATALLTVSCDEDPTDALKSIIKDDLGYVPRISSFTLVQPASTTVPAGSNITLDLRYWSEGTIKDIQFYQIMNGAEVQVGQHAYAPAYSKITRTDSLRYTYLVPGDLSSGTAFSIQARVTNAGLEQYPAKSALLNFKIE